MHPRLNTSFRLLKQGWQGLRHEEQWSLLRSLVIREHLHTNGNFSKRRIETRVVNCAALLRIRRLQIVGHFDRQGFPLTPEVKRLSLPKRHEWRGINAICPL